MKITADELYRETLRGFNADQPGAWWLRVLTRLACLEASQMEHESMWHAVAQMEESRDIEEQFWASEIYPSKDGSDQIIALF